MLHFYDQQLRKYLLQFVRIFGSFTIQKGFDQTGYPIYEQVPARYGDMSRQAGHILKDNSENTLNAIPFISCYVNALEMNPDLRRYPQFEDTLRVIEKRFDQDQHAYVNEPGQSFNVTRYQPVPYKLSMNVDIWSSNTDQKLQLLEQILVLFNPGINLHTNQNPLDWTSLTYCELTNTTWSNRSLPGGADNTIDIATLTFELPIFINPPVKVQRMNIIQTILTQLHTLDLEDFENWTVTTNTTDSNFTIITLEDYWVRFEDGVAILIDNRGNSGALSWKEDVFSAYGELRPGISQIRFRQGNDVTDPSSDIIGTIEYDPSDPKQLLVNVDATTLPTNTQTAVRAIINPQVNYPGDGILGNATVGDRYLILDQLPLNSYWTNLVADANDIIEFNGSNWIVSFDASSNAATQFVTNLTTNDQFEWTGEFWQNSAEGVYRQGWMRLYL